MEPSLTIPPPVSDPGDPAAPTTLSDTPLAEAPLTEFVDLDTLQEVQDSFAALTQLVTVIRDAKGEPITVPTRGGASDEGHEPTVTAPIVLEGHTLGSISIESRRLNTAIDAHDRLRETATRLGVPDEEIGILISAADEAYAPRREASIHFLKLLANSIARLCYQEYQARRRADELSVLHKLSTVFATRRDVQELLDTAVELIASEMRVKAVSIRLLEDDELVTKAVHRLSQAYLDKGAIRLGDSALFQRVLDGEVVYIEDMADDPQVMFPDDAKREGLVSMLCAGIIYQGHPLGTVQVYSWARRDFGGFERQLLESIAQLLGGAIENARLVGYRRQARGIRRQLDLAADVQRRLLSGPMPHLPPLDIAARYVPSMELAGDFYDLIDLDGHLGVAIGDVVGKGVAASLLMATVRASLRAYAQDLYDMDEIVRRVNASLARDSRDHEFATLFYGVLDPETLRLTYCNAGHDPPLLIHRGEIRELPVGGMAVGIDAQQTYTKGIFDLSPGDTLLLYTDGLVDSFNYERERFGRERIKASLVEAIADGRTCADILNHILWCQRNFTGLHRATDDTTLVVVRVADD